jgi:hypothetical protein
MRCLGRDGHVCTAHPQLGGARPLEHGAGTLDAGGHHPFVLAHTRTAPPAHLSDSELLLQLQTVATVHCICKGGGRGTRRLNPRNGLALARPRCMCR